MDMDNAPSAPRYPYLLHLSEGHATLSDALDEMADQLISGEAMFNEERLRTIDEAAPGPYPCEVEMRDATPDQSDDEDDEDSGYSAAFVPDKENQNPNLPYYETHNVNWADPPMWDGIPLKEVPLSGSQLIRYLRDKLGVPISSKAAGRVKCKLDDCEQIVKGGSFRIHIYTHFDVSRVCKRCGFKSRPNVFMSSHLKADAECHADMMRKLGKA